LTSSIPKTDISPRYDKLTSSIPKTDISPRYDKLTKIFDEHVLTWSTVTQQKMPLLKFYRYIPIYK